MDGFDQIRITGFAVAVFLSLMAQLPAVRSLRWWFYASSMGLLAAMAQWMADAPGRMASFAFLCFCAQVGCTASGLLWQSGKLKYLRTAFAASVLTGFALLTVLGKSAQQLAAARSVILLGLLLALVSYLAWRRDRRPWTASILSALLMLGILHQLLKIAEAMHWSDPAFLPLLSRAGGVIGPIAVSAALIFIALHDLAVQDEQLRQRAGHMRQLVDTTDHAICEIDRGGKIAFLNAAAAEMLGVAADPLGEACPGETWMQEKLKADDDESSIRAVSEFVLSPNKAIRQAKARILRPDRPPIWVDWSSTPIERDGKAAGALVTLRDVSEREAALRFIHFRTELLEMIARNKPVEEVSRLLSLAIEERMPGYCCSVLICGSEHFRVIASQRLPEGFRAALHAVPCNRILQTNDRRGSLELRSWEDSLRAIARNHQFGGTWSEPMISPANELLGTVVLHHAFMSPLEPAQSRILREAARLASLAIEHHGAYERLLHQGYHDPLTGLPNRLLLADRLHQALARAERTHLQVAFLSIDLDHFKDINDNFGHDAGDLFLRQISARLATRVRASDTLARTGGDEFTLILPDLQDMHDAGKVAESLTTSLREPFQLQEHTVYGSASVGIALYPRDGKDSDTLQRNADRAMYRAKARGRNLVQFYSGEESSEDRSRAEIERQLQYAIEEGAFSLHFQPQFTCAQELAGFEALLRFQHPKLGMVPPSRFIPMAEESGLILAIGEWVLSEVCRQITAWQAVGLHPQHVSINISPLQLARGDFAATVARTLRNSGISPHLLELEFTEGVLMSGVPDTARQIAELARIGVRLAVDDFGTGYSCLSYLQQLPLHTLKISRSFVSKMLDAEGTQCLVETIVMLARNLGLQTVAEGVEKEEQLALLRAAGCNLIQGFLFSKPLTADDTTSLLISATRAEEGARSESLPPSRNQPSQNQPSQNQPSLDQPSLDPSSASMPLRKAISEPD